MKTRMKSIVRSIVFSSLLILVPYALIPHAGTAIGYLGNGAIAQACPVQVSVSPDSRTIKAGGSTTFQVTVNFLDYIDPKFTGPVTLSVSGLPSGATGSFSGENPVYDRDGNRSEVRTLTIDTTCAVTPGTYRNITITGNAIWHGNPDPSSDSVILIVTAPTKDFTISGGSQTPPSVVPGESADFDITGTFIGCFTGPINLSVDTATLPAGVTFDPFNPSTITADGGTSTLTLKTSANTPVGNHEITVKGTNPNIGTRNTTVTLVVTEPPDFSLSASPDSREIEAGNTADFNITRTFTGGFTGDVALSATGSPSGLSFSFSPESIPGGGTASKRMVVVAPDSVLTVTTGADTEPGTYEITITGRHATLGTRTTTVTLVVTPPPPCFTVDVHPENRNIKAGEDTFFTTVVNWCEGYAGDVTLSVDEESLPTGVTYSFDSNPVSPTGGNGNAETKLNIFTTCETPPGEYTIKVKGTSGGVEESDTVTLTVTEGGDYSISGSSQTPPKVEPGESADFNIAGTFTGCFTGPVSLSVNESTLPAGVTVQSFVPETIGADSPASTLTLKTSADTPVGNHEITVKGTNPTLGERTTVVKLTVTEPQNFTLSADPTTREIKAGEKADFKVIGTFSEEFEGEVELSADISPSGPLGSFSPKWISAKVRDSVLTITTDAETPAGTYGITIIGTHKTLGTRTAKVNLTVIKESEFRLTADPISQEIKAGEKADFKVIGTFSEGFEGEVELSADISPSGPAGSFSPKWISAKVRDSVLTITTDAGTPAGTYGITIIGTHKTLGTRTAKVTLTVIKESEFSLTARPTSQKIEPGETARYTITVNDGGSLPNYTVEFPDPADIGDLVATIDPSSLPPTSNTNSVALTIETGPNVEEGQYTITVNARGGGYTASVDVTLVIGKPPVPESAGLTVDKSVSPSSAKVGQVLLYTIEIANTGRGKLTDVVIRDNMPAGIGYVKGSAAIDGKSISDPSGATTLIWAIDEIDGGKTVTLKYHGVVKPNISRGKSTNTVIVTGTDPTGRTLSARATADIGVSSEDLERKGKIKGKVFIDENKNGLKNVDEEGVAGVWVLLESGERTSTDEEGLFQFDEIDSGEHLVGIDLRKLPKQYFVVGEASKIVSLFSGGTGRTYFGLGRNGPSKKELEEIAKAEEEKKAQEEAALVAEEQKKEEEDKEKNAPKGTLFGKVFIDVNANEIYNPGEKGAESVTVLLDADRKTVTDKLGNFRFDNVKEGRHALSVREDKEFKKNYRLLNKKKTTVNVKASTNNRQDIPVSDRKELQINIKLNAR
jgi:uncharacterized repeat protein (TIGR01451 family)